MLSLNKKVDKQNSHSNVEQNHHDNKDRAVGLCGREREKERKEKSVNKDPHTHLLIHTNVHIVLLIPLSFKEN